MFSIMYSKCYEFYYYLLFHRLSLFNLGSIKLASRISRRYHQLSMCNYEVVMKCILWRMLNLRIVRVITIFTCFFVIAHFLLISLDDLIIEWLLAWWVSFSVIYKAKAMFIMNCLLRVRVMNSIYATSLQ